MKKNTSPTRQLGFAALGLALLLNAGWAAAVPAISSVSPIAGPTAGGIIITIDGTGFLGTLSTTVGTRDCAHQTEGEFQITCTLPEGEGLGVPVQVTSNAELSNTIGFNYGAPVIEGAVYDTGLGILTLTGFNFGLNPQVMVGGAICAISTSDHTSIMCSGAASEGDPVVVTVATQFSEPFLVTLATGRAPSPAAVLLMLPFLAWLFGRSRRPGAALTAA